MLFCFAASQATHSVSSYGIAKHLNSQESPWTCESYKLVKTLSPFYSSHVSHRDTAFPVVSLVVGDFDGDGLIDILTLTLPAGAKCALVKVHWLSLNQGVPEASGKIPGHLVTIFMEY